MEPFNWLQAKSMLSRWGWVEDPARAKYWVQNGWDNIVVPTVEDLDCRDEYDHFVTSLAEIYGLNPFMLQSLLEAEICQ